MKILDLHKHSHYSKFDGVSSPEDYAIGIAENPNEFYQALAISEHGTLAGQLETYKMAKKYGLKYIPAVEIYVDKNRHLLLFGVTERAYRDIIRVNNKACKNQQFYREHIVWTLGDLAEVTASGEVYVAGACIGGYWNWDFAENRFDDGVAKIKELLNFIPKDKLLLEYQTFNDEKQTLVNVVNNHLIKEMGLNAIISSDAHVLYREDIGLINVARAMGWHQTVEQINEKGIHNTYLKNYDDYIRENKQFKLQVDTNNFKLFEQTFEKIYNEVEDFNLYREQSFSYGDKESNIKRFDDLIDSKLSQYDDEIYINRGNYEREVIKNKGFVDYFLKVKDTIELGKENGIVFGGGRGSGAGSLIAYLLGITRIDPIKYNLLFERFLKVDRVEMPDLDIDVSDRQKLVSLLAEQEVDYDVTAIGNKNTLGLKNTLKYMFKVFDIDYPIEGDYFSSFMHFSKLIENHDCKSVSDFYMLEDFVELLSHFNKMNTGYDFKNVLESFIGNLSGTGVHAGGICFLPKKQDNVPYVYVAKQEYPFGAGYSESGTIRELEEVGEVKFDFLGVSTLEVVSDAINGTPIADIYDIGFEDEAVFKHIQELYTYGIFQLQSSGMRNLIEKLKPSNMEELSALIAIYRPGCLNAGLDKDIVKAKKEGCGKEMWDESVLAYIEDIVAPTYYQAIYQEQVMQIGQRLADLDSRDIDDFRKFISTKNLEESNPEKYAILNQKFHVAFMENGKAKGINEEVLNTLWSQLQGFSAYAFNKSHSMAYAHLTYITAYLSLYYPTNWYKAVLTQKRKDGELIEAIPIIKKYISNRELSIKILPPNINNISCDMTISNGDIVLGLNDVKGIGESATKELLKLQGKEDYTPIDLMNDKEISKRSVNTRVICDLMAIGFFGDLPEDEYLKYYEQIKTSNMTKKATAEFDINEVVQDFPAFIFGEQMRLLGFSLKEYPYLQGAMQTIAFVYDRMPDIADADFDFIYKIENVTKRLTKVSKKRFYHIKAITINGNKITFNIFTEIIMQLENVFGIDISDKKNYQKKFAFLFDKDKFLNVRMMIPIK